MLEAKPITSPMFSSNALCAYEGDPMEDPLLYRNTVGSLKYLSLSICCQSCLPIHALTNKASLAGGKEDPLLPQTHGVSWAATYSN